MGKICLITMYILLASSFLLFTASVVLHLCLDEIFKSILKKFILLTPDSTIYQSWVANSTPLLASIYIFDLLNEHEVLNGGKPLFEEVGPFTYWKMKHKWNISFSSESPPKHLHYTQTIFYLPHENLSSSSINDREVTSLDLFTAGLVLQNMSFVNDKFFRNSKAFIKRRPDEILWGYTQEQIAACSVLPVCPEKVSVLHRENNSNIETIVIKTGVDDINDRGRVVEFKGKRKFDMWENEYARRFNGSDGAFMGFGLSVGVRKHVFVPGVCRSVVMEATELIPHPQYPRLKVLKFEPAEGDIDPTFYPPPSEFCKGKSYEPKCAPEGFIAFTPCITEGLPLYGSQGHFLGVDPRIRSQVIGINEPDEINDKTVMLVEPLTGITLGAHQVMQINYYINNTMKSIPFENMRDSYFFPIIRIVIEVNISEDILDTIYNMLYGTQYWFNLGVYVLGGVCLLLFFFSATRIVHMSRNSM
ncbi:hypothetical protein MN116_000316 [Schistosoma mekongi]|uniref:Uncharacterized protein n=1 Tax=Schistosoma mekongi TaxID=38744 RepID=A0AAE1ZH89_SCHME|nr:hypothetical protein MN116_000316 [Schistosoma mekongi]